MARIIGTCVSSSVQIKTPLTPLLFPCSESVPSCCCFRRSVSHSNHSLQSTNAWPSPGWPFDPHMKALPNSSRYKTREKKIMLANKSRWPLNSKTYFECMRFCHSVDHGATDAAGDSFGIRITSRSSTDYKETEGFCIFVCYCIRVVMVAVFGLKWEVWG